ncbi:MAG: T9SS type A sorting domain-containing protein [Parvicellaceae bacterium]
MMNFDPKKLIIFTTLIFLNLVVSSQESVIWYDFESYSNGYDFVSNNSSNWWNNGGTGGGGIITNSSGTGYNSSDAYMKSGDGWNKFQYNFSPTNGSSYKFYFQGQLTAYYGNNLKIQIYRLNNNGDGDDVLISEVTWATETGSTAINTWKTVDIDYTATSDDASSANGIALRLFKTYGTGMNIDDFRVSCTSCEKATYASGNWSSTNTWGGYSVPAANENSVVKHNVTVDASTNNLGNLTVNSGKTLTISASQTVDVGGTFDASGATIDMNSSSRLELAGTVSNLGTLDAAAGTIEYDGGTQDVLADAYYNLEIDETGVKTSLGTVSAAGTLTVGSGATYAIAATTTTVSGNSDINGAFTASTGEYDADGVFDATGGTITFSGAGELRVSGTVTSLGALGTSAGSIEYDGGTQNVLADAYYNLEIDESGVKTSQGTVTTAGTLTVGSGATYAIAATSTTVTGSTDINGTLTASTGTFDANGAFDANGGNVTFSGDGRLQCSNTVTNLGTLSTDNGTVEYDGGTQTIFTGTYYNLEIDQSGTKSIGAQIHTEGDLIITAGTLEMAGNNINCAGNFINSGTLSSSGTASFQLDGNGGTTNCGGFSDTDINLRKQGSSQITTTGDITCRGFHLNGSNSNNFIIDGETITVDKYVTIEAGSLQITSGALTATTNTGSTNIYTGYNLNGGTLDIDGGTVSFGETSDNTAALNINGGTLDVSGGTLNVSDEIIVGAIADGTITQTGGTINIRNYNGSDNQGTHKFDVDAGTLNLTAGTININGESGTSSHYSIDIESGVTVNANANHTIVIMDNTSGTSTENRYIDMGGNNIGSLTYNVSAKNLYFVGSHNILGSLSILDGTVKADDASETITVALINQSGGFIDISAGEIECSGKADIDGKLIITGGTFDCNGELELSSSTTEGITGGSITLSSDFDGANANNFTPTGGTMTLDGSASDVDLSLHSSGNLYNLTVNNSNGVALTGGLAINGTLTFTSGDINTSTNTLTLGTSSIVSGANDDKHVNGTCARSITSSFLFPVGDGTRYRAISVAPENANATTYSVKYNHAAHSDLTVGSGLDHVSPGYHWDVNRTSGSENATLSVAWTYQEQYGTTNYNHDPLVIFWSYFDGSDWQKINSTPSGSTQSGSLISAVNTNWSNENFTLGASTASFPPLPLDLISFNGECRDNLVNIEFLVASQVANEYFTIERSENILHWEEIGNLDGGGTTNEEINYSFVDYSPKEGENYYRLKQTDINGNIKYFSPIVVECKESVLNGYSVYPNPTNNLLKIDFELNNYQGESTEMRLIDLKGNIIKSQNVELKRGHNHLEIDLSELKNGIYILNFLGSRDAIKISRVIKQ